MTVNTVNSKTFELLNDNGAVMARLIYNNPLFDDAVMEMPEKYLLNGITTGTWVTTLAGDSSGKRKSTIRVETGGIITLRLLSKKKKYFFKKSAGWRLRFSLSTKENEDLLTIIPNVNWKKESHDYILQLNDEFEIECNAWLILQAVHCANCSLSMMTGGRVPALVSM